MNLKSILKTIVRVAPVVLQHAPVVIAAVREVKKATKRKEPPRPT